MPVKFNINKAIKGFEDDGGTTAFPKSLKKVLRYAQNDNNIESLESMAYLLATAKAESDYSLQRWESDYVCDSKGIPYVDYPCDRALNYYRSTSGGKHNYYNLGVDEYGIPYFGRGLIQLTGKGNYEKYGDIIGVDLISDGDKALEPKNSYKITSAFLNRKRGSNKKSVFDYVHEGNFTMARKRVNGGTKGVSRVNSEYNRWVKVLNDSNFIVKFWTRKKRIIATSLIGGVVLAGTIVGFYYLWKNAK